MEEFEIPEKIDHFNGHYRFLSNFYPLHKLTVEHVFQAAKTFDEDWWTRILLAPKPADAKRLGRNAPLRDDWEDIKVDVMEHLLMHKFSNGEMRQRLAATAPAILEEGNRWGDRFWGTVGGNGENHLGLLLMKIRDEHAR